MVRRSIFVLGRQAGIAKAELESLFGAERLEPVGSGDFGMACDLSPDTVPFSRIGGSIRLCQPLAVFPNGKWSDIGRKLVKYLPSLVDTLPIEGKVKLGLSVYGLPAGLNDILRTGLELKKAARNSGRTMRVVPNNEQALNTAQVTHNSLLDELGIELIVIADGSQVQLARTITIQDIDDYASRDQGRPKRDAFVGMLPPKLAQIIVNLGAAQLPPVDKTVILDPFCGTGVILQESLLMGYGAYGTDLNERMVDYSRQNLEWLADHRDKVAIENIELEVGDATMHRWRSPFSAVACEGYLGRPLTALPKPEMRQEIMGTCNVIMSKFLTNIGHQLTPGTRLCVALPAWVSETNHIYHLPLLDQIEVLGYNRVSFSWASGKDMVYYRPGQVVARELLVITRK